MHLHIGASHYRSNTALPLLLTRDAYYALILAAAYMYLAAGIFLLILPHAFHILFVLIVMPPFQAI